MDFDLKIDLGSAILFAAVICGPTGADGKGAVS